jgi:hypothetical protein
LLNSDNILDEDVNFWHLQTGLVNCQNLRGLWYVSAVKGLAMEWLHETFGKRNVVERWFFYIKHRIKRFYKRFPWNAKYETVYRWLASFIVIYTIMNLKS